MSLREDAAELQQELAALRRELHQIPEIGLDLPKTQERVLAALHPLPLEVSTGTGLSSITAVLRGVHVAPQRRDARVRSRPAHRRSGRRRAVARRAPGRAPR